MIQRCINFVQHCLDVVSTSGTDFVSTLCNVENPMLNFVSFSTLNQSYFNVNPQRWNNVDSTSKYWLGCLYVSEMYRKQEKIKSNGKYNIYQRPASQEWKDRRSRNSIYFFMLSHEINNLLHGFRVALESFRSSLHVSCIE